MLDGIKSKGIENYLRSEYGKYFDSGELNVELNTSAKSCVLKAKLVGENSPIAVCLKRYEVLAKGSDRFLKVHEISADKEWLSVALNDFLLGKEFKIPAFVAAAL